MQGSAASAGGLQQLRVRLQQALMSCSSPDKLREQLQRAWLLGPKSAGPNLLLGTSAAEDAGEDNSFFLAACNLLGTYLLRGRQRGQKPFPGCTAPGQDDGKHC